MVKGHLTVVVYMGRVVFSSLTSKSNRDPCRRTNNVLAVLSRFGDETYTGMYTEERGNPGIPLALRFLALRN